jgi:hypothetical protein
MLHLSVARANAAPAAPGGPGNAIKIRSSCVGSVYHLARAIDTLQPADPGPTLSSDRQTHFTTCRALPPGWRRPGPIVPARERYSALRFHGSPFGPLSGHLLSGHPANPRRGLSMTRGSATMTHPPKHWCMQCERSTTRAIASGRFCSALPSNEAGGRIGTNVLTRPTRMFRRFVQVHRIE